MKTCSACGKSKAATEFQVRAASKDGLTAACRACLHARDQARYPREAKARAARHREYVNGAGKAISQAAKKRWIAKNQDKRAAHTLLNNALRDGRITKSACEVCGSKKSQAHHDDYTKPLDVRWLCPKHHAAWHKANPSAPN